MTGPIRDIGQKVLQPYFEKGSSSSAKYCHILLLIVRREEAFISNIIIIIYINYIIILYIKNNAVINNYYGKLQAFILFFKISMGTRKNFFEIYGLFEHAPSKRFASPRLSVTNIYNLPYFRFSQQSL
jgi:hypothetical protein